MAQRKKISYRCKTFNNRSKRSTMNRLRLGSVLVACLLVLSTYHYLNHDLHKAYPDTEDVINGVEGTVSVGGTVVHSGDEAFTLRLTHGACGERR